MHDHHQHTVHRLASHVLLRGERRDPVRVLDPDGAERRLLGWPLLGLHRRGVRAQAEGRADVGHERFLLRRLADVHTDIRRHVGLEADSVVQHVRPDHKHRDPVHGKCGAITTAYIQQLRLLFVFSLRTLPCGC